MLVKLKQILNTYTDAELEEIILWVDSITQIEQVIIEDWAINLITEKAEIKINSYITKESKEKVGLKNVSNKT